MKDRSDKHGVLDKREWDRGVWQTEPDECSWKDAMTGYSVHVLRDEKSGALGFAVGIPEGHPAYGHEHAPVSSRIDASLTPGVEEDGLWWFGYRFDLEHQGRPAQKMNLSLYRNIHEVRAASTRLCHELWDFAQSQYGATPVASFKFSAPDYLHQTGLEEDAGTLTSADFAKLAEAAAPKTEHQLRREAEVTTGAARDQPAPRDPDARDERPHPVGLAPRGKTEHQLRAEAEATTGVKQARPGERRPAVGDEEQSAASPRTDANELRNEAEATTGVTRTGP